MKVICDLIDLAAKIEACPGNLIADVQGESVILQIETGQYFGLNEVATRIWQIIQEPVCVESMLGILESEYDVERTMLLTDVI